MTQKRFLVALSFPGEHRDYILQVAELLAETLGPDAILYDAWYKAEFTRPNLDIYLQNLYKTESQLLVPFFCADYENKDWCQLEWRVIRSLIKQKKDDDLVVGDRQAGRVVLLRPCRRQSDLNRPTVR